MKIWVTKVIMFEKAEIKQKRGWGLPIFDASSSPIELIGKNAS